MTDVVPTANERARMAEVEATARVAIARRHPQIGDLNTVEILKAVHKDADCVHFRTTGSRDFFDGSEETIGKIVDSFVRQDEFCQREIASRDRAFFEESQALFWEGQAPSQKLNLARRNPDEVAEMIEEFHKQRLERRVTNRQ